VNGQPQILQLDVAGNPVRWIDYEKGAYYIVKNLVAWTPSDKGFTVYGGTNRITNSRSFLDMNTIIAVKGDMNDKHLHRAPTLTNRGLFRRDQNLCAYCGQIFSHDKLTRDHILPTSRKGADKWNNVVTACGGCNKAKDNMTPEEADMPLIYLPYVPSRAEHLILSNRNILADQMSFLMEHVSEESRLKKPVTQDQLPVNRRRKVPSLL
jgi:hypothetical protein